MIWNSFSLDLDVTFTHHLKSLQSLTDMNVNPQNFLVLLSLILGSFPAADMILLQSDESEEDLVFEDFHLFKDVFSLALIFLTCLLMFG